MPILGKPRERVLLRDIPHVSNFQRSRTIHARWARSEGMGHIGMGLAQKAFSQAMNALMKSTQIAIQSSFSPKLTLGHTSFLRNLRMAKFSPGPTPIKD